MSEELKKGCVVFMKASSGLLGYGNAQCVSDHCPELGTVSLYGHNQCYKTYDIDKIVESPADSSKLASLQAENEHLSDLVDAVRQEKADYLKGTLEEKLQAELQRYRWIPMEEGPPVHGSIVDFILKGKVYGNLVRKTGYTWRDRLTSDYEPNFMITHWMPIPKLPEIET